MSKRIQLLFFLHLFFFPATAQSESPKYKMGTAIKLHKGFVLMHRQGVEHLVQDHIDGFQIDLFQTPNGSKDWHRYAKFPDVGLSIIYMNLGSDELGQAVGLLPSMSFYKKEKGRFTFSSKGGMGLGYINSTWSRVEHRTNVMIGSHINLAVTLQSDMRFALTESILLEAGFAFTHFSNAGTTKPNLGINIPSAAIGLRYQLKNYEPLKQLKDTTKVNHKAELLILSAGFINQFSELYPHRFALSTSLEYGKFNSYKRNRFHGAIDLFYNGELSDYYNNEDITYSAIDEFQLGISAGYTRILGKLHLIGAVGTYVLYKDLPTLSIYNRFGLRYALNERFMLNGTVKTHLFVANYYELGAGFKLWKR